VTPTELRNASSPDGLPPLLAALWHDQRGDWERAHEITQGVSGAAGARVHAYLHRKEGDHGNASYWYARAGTTMPACSLDEEWDLLVEELS